MATIETEQHIAAAVDALQAADPRLVPLVAATGPLPLRRRADGFAGLVAIIVAQQLSRASADAIHARLVREIGPPTHRALASAPDATLRGVGLSRPKIATLRALAVAVADGSLDVTGLRDMADAEVSDTLCRVRGIGPWTAEIYLLSCLGRADVFPARDLALQEAARIGLGLAGRPDPDALLVEAEIWRPWRSVAAVLLWAYYRHVRGETGDAAREQGGAAA